MKPSWLKPAHQRSAKHVSNVCKLTSGMAKQVGLQQTAQQGHIGTTVTKLCTAGYHQHAENKGQRMSGLSGVHTPTWVLCSLFSEFADVFQLHLRPKLPAQQQHSDKRHALTQHQTEFEVRSWPSASMHARQNGAKSHCNGWPPGKVVKLCCQAMGRTSKSTDPSTAVAKTALLLQSPHGRVGEEEAGC